MCLTVFRICVYCWCMIVLFCMFNSDLLCVRTLNWTASSFNSYSCASIQLYLLFVRELFLHYLRKNLAIQYRNEAECRVGNRINTVMAGAVIYLSSECIWSPSDPSKSKLTICGSKISIDYSWIIKCDHAIIMGLETVAVVDMDDDHHPF